MQDPLKTAFNSRYQNLMERSKLWKVSPPVREGLWQKLVASRANFCCCYCGCWLKVKEPPPSSHVFSFDHDRPFAHGGTNDLANIVIGCHACNIVKGTMKGDTFKEVVRHLPLELRDRMFMEIWRGRLKDKLERLQEEKISSF